MRSIDDFNGQKRIREFYAMKPEEAYAILEAMAEIHACKENLKLVAPNDIEVQDEQLAQEIDTESHERAENFSFSKCQIAIGEEIEYYSDSSIKCVVVGDRKVEYQGKEMSLTAAAKLISGKKYSIAGPKFFKYKGEWLNDMLEWNNSQGGQHRLRCFYIILVIAHIIYRQNIKPNIMRLHGR